jgi:hypothetical protein
VSLQDQLCINVIYYVNVFVQIRDSLVSIVTSYGIKDGTFSWRSGSVSFAIASIANMWHAQPPVQYIAELSRPENKDNRSPLNRNADDG